MAQQQAMAAARMVPAMVPAPNGMLLPGFVPNSWGAPPGFNPYTGAGTLQQPQMMFAAANHMYPGMMGMTPMSIQQQTAQQQPVPPPQQRKEQSPQHQQLLKQQQQEQQEVQLQLQKKQEQLRAEHQEQLRAQQHRQERTTFKKPAVEATSYALEAPIVSAPVVLRQQQKQQEREQQLKREQKQVKRKMREQMINVRSQSPSAGNEQECSDKKSLDLDDMEKMIDLPTVVHQPALSKPGGNPSLQGESEMPNKNIIVDQ